MVLPPAVSLTPSTRLNRMEKALPHTPATPKTCPLSIKQQKAPVLSAPVEIIIFTHQEVKGVLFVLPHNTSHEELASKQVGRHEGPILCHSDFIWTELHPI